MARTTQRPMPSESDEEQESAPQLKTKNKENRVPQASSFSLTAAAKSAGKNSSRHSSGEEERDDGSEEEEVSTNVSKATSKRRAAPAAKRTSAADNNKSRGGGAAAPRGKKAVAELDEMDEDDESESSGVVQETQDDDEVEMDLEEAGAAPRKGARKPAAGAKVKAVAVPPKKGKAAVECEGEGPSAKETRLQAKLDATTAALEKTKAAFEQLRDLRETRAEASEKALSDIANERYEQAHKDLKSFKAEIESLRAENVELRRGSRAISDAVSPKASRTSTTGVAGSSEVRVAELENALAASEAKREKLADALKEREGAEREKLEGRDARWQKELAKTVTAKDKEAAVQMTQLKSDLTTVQQELEAEIQHSKSIQAKLKSGSGVGPTAAGGNTSMSASGSAFAKLQEEFQSLKTRSELAEDLSGLSIRSRKLNDDGSSTYSCLLNDCRGKAGTLIFKLTFLLDGGVCYEPDIQVERDPVLFTLLADDYKNFMRFDGEQAMIWFLALFKGVNKPLGAVLVAVYLALVLNLLPTPFLSQSIRDQIVPCLPFNLLVALGSYCLWELGMGVLTFGECGDAYEELRKEIKEATEDLRAKGVSVD
ncbi:hypothetical protein RQP46_004499 [Phenoliferia psychrophenolica]